MASRSRIIPAIRMSNPIESAEHLVPGKNSEVTVNEVTPSLLRDWSLPEAGDTKHGRGRIVVVGGSAKTPGAAMLAGVSALRVGAGHLTLLVAEVVAPAVAVAVPEAGVIGLAQTSAGSVRGERIADAEQTIGAADVVLIGPGLDDPGETQALLDRLPELVGVEASVVLDAYALGVLRDSPRCQDAFGGRIVLTPNEEEAARLLGRDEVDSAAAVLEIAETYDAVVTCHGSIANAAGDRWRVTAGHAGLATSGSGDVLAGALSGLLGRGAAPEQAACWASYVHAAAGDRLAARVGALGFLARELHEMLPVVMTELSA
jgi:ADP-dependent NAD(P)H-hydrate dehydratase